MKFKIGDKVQDRKTGEIGVLIAKENYPFLYYNVKMKRKGILEYHRGELKTIKGVI